MKKIGTNSVSTLTFAFKKLNMKHILSNQSWQDRGSLIFKKSKEQKAQRKRTKLVHIYSVGGGRERFKID